MSTSPVHYVAIPACFFDQTPLVLGSLWLAFGVQPRIPYMMTRKVTVSTFIYSKLPGLVRSRKIKPNVTTKWEGGLEKVPDAIDYLAAGKVSGAKIVFGL